MELFEDLPFEATSESPLRKPVRKATFQSFLRKTFRTHQPGRLSFGAPSESDTCPRKNPPFGAFRNLPKPCRRPLFEVSAEAPAGPSFGDRHLSRKPFLRKPLSTRLRTKPFGPSFGTRHVSRRLSRKTLSKTTYVPEALPRIPPEAFFETPPFPDSSRAATCPRIPRTGRISPGCRPSLPSVPECLNSKLPPGALRAATCPETPEYLPEAPNALRARVPSEFNPDASGCAACPE